MTEPSPLLTRWGLMGNLTRTLITTYSSMTSSRAGHSMVTLLMEVTLIHCTVWSGFRTGSTARLKLTTP
ncbi:hypothetical protein [Paenibacillus sp. PDC88]|uniref:hypothetical protein n=1 Tax=Paenibacillus sp. PDC88 TaxID=1884375 RepID=UPI00115F84CF|nr:hypothetical protein [Paenibacillus sp. PDC88]